MNYLEKPTKTLDYLRDTKEKKHSFLAAIMTAFYCTLVSATSVFASSDSVVQGITKGTEEVWKLLIGIVAPIAAGAAYPTAIPPPIHESPVAIAAPI